jgi:phage replication-related protein YjqB (UPF0714/DUF867 family)
LCHLLIVVKNVTFTIEKRWPFSFHCPSNKQYENQKTGTPDKKAATTLCRAVQLAGLKVFAEMFMPNRAFASEV